MKGRGRQTPTPRDVWSGFFGRVSLRRFLRLGFRLVFTVRSVLWMVLTVRSGLWMVLSVRSVLWMLLTSFRYFAHLLNFRHLAHFLHRCGIRCRAHVGRFGRFGRGFRIGCHDGSRRLFGDRRGDGDVLIVIDMPGKQHGIYRFLPPPGWGRRTRRAGTGHGGRGVPGWSGRYAGRFQDPGQHG